MSILFTNTSSQYLDVTSNLLNSDVWSASYWYMPTDTSFDACMFWSGNDGVTNQFFTTQVAAGGSVNCNARNTTSQRSTTVAQMTDGVWNHGLAYVASTTDRRSYLDNSSEATNTNSVSGINAVTDAFDVGRLGDSSPGNYAHGRIAELAIWNIALTDSADRQILADGFSPLFVKPDNLILYWRFLNIGDLTDRISRITLAANNGPVSADHPPIIMPAAQILQFPPPVSGSVTLTADPGSLALTGAASAFKETILASPGSLVLSGATAEFVIATVLNAEPGSLTLSGADAAFAETLNAEPGSLVLSGASAEFGTDRTIVALPGSLLLGGASAEFITSGLRVRRGGRFLVEPDPEIREEKVKELVALVKPAITPKSTQDSQEPQVALLTMVLDATTRMTPAQQTRLDRLLQQTGVSLDELLIILS